MLKETIWVNKRNKTLTIKSVGLDLALIIGADSDLTTLLKDNASRLRSPKVMRINPKIIIGRDLTRTSRIRSHVSIITAARRAI